MSRAGIIVDVCELPDGAHDFYVGRFGLCPQCWAHDDSDVCYCGGYRDERDHARCDARQLDRIAVQS